MILLLHPRATRPKNRRFPLSILAIAAVLEGNEEYAIIDGNADPSPGESLERLMQQKPAELLAVSVMPGPQTAAAVPLCRDFRKNHPEVPIVWGGYFPSLYPDAALNAGYVDFVVRGQGEETFLELLEALRGSRRYGGIPGLSYKDAAGRHVHNMARPLRSPDDFPWYPYHRLDAGKYVRPTFLGSRTAVHQASIGCPYRCSFCGVARVFDRQKMESPARTAAILSLLQQRYGVNAVQFYDNNFFLREDHARELAGRLEPLGMRWWCEARVDAVLGYSDQTLRQLRRAGAAMIFFGTESGDDAALRRMKKHLRSEQTLELARRIREFGIVPEFSFIFGDPEDPDGSTRDLIEFIRKVKKSNPQVEIVVQTYVPVPRPDGASGGVENGMRLPATPEEWAAGWGYRLATRSDPPLPWLSRRIRRRIRDFDTVISSRWPTMQDVDLPRWGRALLQGLSSWRYALGIYDFPVELRWTQKLLKLRQPRLESL